MMKKLGVFLLSIFIFFILSCEIGLGASVDTEAPVLEITNPPADAVIRDNFAIQGIWTDDGTLSSVSVEMVRLENNQKTSFTGTITSTSEKNISGNWNIVISPKESGLIDGTYEAVVSINDNGGHTTTMARTFTIDNTPPVMILQKPSTTISDAANRFDTFGQIFSIVGQASDDNLVDKIDVSVYSDPSCVESSFIKKITLDSVPPTIDLNVATFKEGTSNDYSDIYGYTTIGYGNVQRYFKLEVYDMARKYNPDGTIEAEGNKQTSYYLYKEISDLINEYKATGLYKILSGTRSTNSAETKTHLESDKREIGKFQLNPDNSPTFVVSARSPLAAGEVLSLPAYQFTSGTNLLEIQIDPGLDNTPIIEDSIGIYLVECNEEGKIEDGGVVIENQNPAGLPDDRKIWLVYPKTESNPEAHEESNVTITPSGDSYKFKTTKVISSLNYGNSEQAEAPNALQIEHYYLICVEGYDKQNNAIVPYSNSLYAFQLASSGSFIELVADAEPYYVTSNESSNGEDSTEKNVLTVTLRYQGESNSYKIFEDNSDSELVANPPAVVIEEKQAVIKKDRTALASYKNLNKSSLKYQVKGGSDAASKIKDINFIIDDTLPVIKDDTIKIGNEAYNENTFSSSLYLKISGEIEEENLDTVYYYVQYPGRGEGETNYQVPENLAKIHDGEISKFENNSFVFPAVEFKDNTESAANKLYIQAMDKAGNLSIRKEFTINVDTSSPQLKAYWSKIGTGAYNSASETIYVKENADLYIYGEYCDNQSGVNQLELPEGFPTGASVKYSTKALTGTNNNELDAFTDEDWKNYSDIENKMQIKSWCLKYTPEASGSVELKGSSIAGKTVSVNAYTLVLDKKEPEINSINLFNVTGSADNKKESKAYYDSKKGKYFVNQKVPENKTFSIKGSATDNYGLEKIQLEITTTSGTKSYSAEEDCSSAVCEFTFENIDMHDWTENPTATIYAKDKAGNESNSLLVIIFDTEAPYGLHEIDSSSKDLYFRVGNSDNDDIKPGETGWNENLDKEAGKKYSNGAFGNAQTIRLRGSFSDVYKDEDENEKENSGVSMIYYKVFEDEQIYSTDAALELLKNDVLTSPTGSFAPLAEAETRRVFYNVSGEDPFNGTELTGTGKYYKEIESTFNESISGFKEGNNYLVLVAVDNVGNSAVDMVTVDINGTPTKCINYSLNVDITPPSDILTRSINGILYTNGTNIPMLWGTVSDQSSKLAAGVESFVLYRDGVNTKVYAELRSIRKESEGEDKPADSDELIALAETDSTLKIWEADISPLVPTIAANECKTVSISATATDAAGSGNSTPGVVVTITIDKVSPDVTINEGTPVDADPEEEGIQVNGKISLSGTGYDDNGIEELVGLYYKIYEGDTVPSAPAENTIIEAEGTDGWKKVQASQTGTLNWTFTNIDTTKLDGETEIPDNSKVCFTVAIKDKPGNIGYSDSLPLVINQDTDRPIIHLSTLALTYIDENESVQRMDASNPVWLTRSEITGTVDDDDGVVEYVKVIAKALDEVAEPSESEWAAAANVYRNGIWSYTITSNGPKKIYFQVKDKIGSIFTSNINSSVKESYGPKIQDTESEKFGYPDNTNTAKDDIIYVKVDTNDPILDYFSYYKSEEIIADTSEIVWTNVNTSVVSEKIGGTKKYLYIKCQATDTNGIHSISADITSAKQNPVSSQSTAIGETSMEYIGYFDISEIASGNTELTIHIKDKAAAATANSAGISKYYEITVDNTPPSIGFSNYNTGAQVYGSSAVTLRGTTSDSNTVTTVEYALTKTSSSSGLGTSDWTVITKEDDRVKDSYTSALGWQIVFDDKLTQLDTSSFHAALLKKSVFELYTIGTEAQADYETISPVYIWIRATDEFGNSAVNSTPFYFDVIPNGDKPAINITYPNNGDSVGGTIRITGESSIQDLQASVESIYIQIDPNYNGTSFNENWADDLGTLLEANNVEAYEIETLADSEDGKKKLGTVIKKGIKAKGSVASWFLPVNANMEFNEKVENHNRTIAIRAYAVGSTGKITCSEVYYCTIDPDAPVFGNTHELRFVQYDDSALTHEIASRKYESGINLTGKWYLVGSVEDQSGIYSILLTEEKSEIKTTTNIVSNGSISDAGKVAENTIASNSVYKNYDIKIPVGSTDENQFGLLKYQIQVQDGSQLNTPNKLEFEISYDNKAPEFEILKGNGNYFTDAEGNPIEENRIIRQSDRRYTVLGSFKETSIGGSNQSGFGRIAMFFTRKRIINDVETLCLLDPMVDDGNNGDANFFSLGTYSESELSLASGIVKKSGLYWRTAKAKVANGNELTVQDSEMPLNVRVGGLCMVENVIYRIKSITAKTLTLEGTLSDISEEGGKDVYFALAQIIDNQSQESGLTTIITETTVKDETVNADGDYMVEGVTLSGGEYTWFAELDSSNMLDGNIDMCFVAFDVAGNITEKSMAQKILNNAPRIAGVCFGADKNLDGDVKGNELITKYKDMFKDLKITSSKDDTKYNGQDDHGNWIISYNPYEGTTNRLVIKGGLKVIPEIVGGNHGLGWQYTYKKKNTEALQSTNVSEYDGVGHSNDGSIREDTLDIDIRLLDFLNIDIEEGQQDLIFTIWDKTDGSILGNEASGSAKASIILPVDIKIRDGVAPTTQIKPFYWESKDKNSLYKNSAKYGHIELEGELPSGTGIPDTDAKVSGKVTFEVTAEDNVIVDTLQAKIDNYNDGKVFTIAERTNGVWTSTNNSTEKSLIGENASDWVFEFISDENEEDGKNIVQFKFHFNTEKISGTAKENVGITFIAKDKGSPSASGNDIVYSAATIKTSLQGTDPASGYYKVDVVPYIKGVKTILSSIKKTNSSIYDRTALGHYPTPSDGKIYLYGFNLEGGDLYDSQSTPVHTPITAVAANNASHKWYYSAFEFDTVYETTSIENFKSGKVYVKNNNVQSLNNDNNDDAKGSYNFEDAIGITGNKTAYSNYYNRQPNGDNNNLLTDDVILDVWEFHSEAVKPISGNVEQPQMKINPKTGQLGFAFVNGPLYFSMPGKVDDTDYSYQYWCACLDFFTSVGLAYDKNGNSYAVAAGGDINTDTADKFSLLSDHFGRAFDTPDNPTGQSSKEAGNLIRMDLVGMKGTKSNQSDTTNYFEKQRFKSPSLATAVHGDNTNVYLAYYDAMTNEIRFKSGTKQPGYDIANTSKAAFNATEYMKWYYHAIYKNEESVNKKRQLLFKDSAEVKAPSIPVQATFSGVSLSQLEYDVTSSSRGSSSAPDSGTPVIIVIKDYTDDQINSLVLDMITAKLASKNLGTEEQAYATVMAKAEEAYNNGTSADFWAMKTNDWNNNNLVKKALEEISVVVRKRTPTKAFGDFKDTEASKQPHVYNNDTAWIIAGDGTSYGAGEYVSIGVVSEEGDTVDDVVVGVWYDAEERTLKYSYNKNPTRLRSSAGAVATEADWEEPINVFTGDMENAGEYCQLAVDGNGGVHIAAYDGSNSDLVYAYLSSYNAESVTCVVDSAGVVGANLTIDVALEDGKAIPRISYYSNSCVRPKLAYLADTSSVNPDGSDEEVFTGKWEITVVPTEKTLNMQSAQYNKINVAVWKTTEGVLTNCLDSETYTQTATSDSNDTENTLNAFKSNSYGFVYGNGTSHAIMGYAVKQGSNSTIETAQLK